MKFLLDMNLSPAWVSILETAGLEAVHWSTVGNPSAEDRELMAWARQNGCTVFTNDLDFSAMLALTRGVGPSMLQIRTQDLMPQPWERSSSASSENTHRCFRAAQL